MRRFGPFLLAAVLLGAAIPVLAVSESAPDELEHNRRLLDRYRADPEHYARLVRDLHTFQALPADRQERMRRFDRELHEEDSATQNRLWGVLERYSAWVGRLPEADQRRIDEAANRTERLAVVKDLRQKEWIDRLPNAERVDLLTLQEPRRSARLADLRKEEAQRRQEWQDWANGQKTRPDPAPPPNKPARSALPDVPDRLLFEFARTELTPGERASLKLAKDDPTGNREILKEAYFKKYPHELQRLRRLERRAAAEKP